MATPPRRRLIPFLRLTDAEEATVARWLRGMVWVFLLLFMLVIPLVWSGFFREQARLKQARALIETGGYAYCAIWGDGTDPFQLMARNSPLLPRWKGELQTDGAYLMTFSYRRSGREYHHRWKVDLQEKRVSPTGEMAVPVRSGGAGEMKCTE